MKRAFFGGVHPKGYKELSREAAIVPLHPSVVSVAMSQHIGAPCQPLVKVGDRVTVGQKIGDGQGLCVPVHASVSGTVTAIEARPHPGGNLQTAIVIESDGRDTLCPTVKPRDPEAVAAMSAEDLIAVIREAGITGMGGAGFPTSVKLSSGLGKVDTVIVNARGVRALHHVRRPPDARDAGARRRRPARRPADPAAEARRHRHRAEQARGHRGHLRAVLRQRHRACCRCTSATHRARKSSSSRPSRAAACPPAACPPHVGCAVFNAATCAAIYDAVYLGLPLVCRGCDRHGQRHRKARQLPGPHRHGLFRRSSRRRAASLCAPYKILCGGPMMGIAQYTLRTATIKGNNALTCYSDKDRHETPNPHCIRCGKCVEACPMHLMPLFLHRAVNRGDLERLDELHVMDCIECGSLRLRLPGGHPARAELPHRQKARARRRRP